ncbi:MAG: hypothetical protein K6G90_06770 [Clostridia bacterium]|nr:hypothetical protein [Clostridia bacterium]
MKKNHPVLCIDWKSPAAIISMIAFALAVPFRLIGYADKITDPMYGITQVLLPVLCSVLMIVFLIKKGKDALWLTVIPVFLGVLSFMFKLFIDPRSVSFLHHAAAVVLYLAVIALWLLTVIYVIKTKWVLVILFILPFIKHVFMDDMPIFLGKAPMIPADMWFKELSMLLTMVALSLCALSFRKSDTPKSAL